LKALKSETTRLKRMKTRMKKWIAKAQKEIILENL
jgi:hypothetical protein